MEETEEQVVTDSLKCHKTLLKKILADLLSRLPSSHS